VYNEIKIIFFKKLIFSKNMWIFTDEEKKIISSIVQKGRIEQQKNEKFAIMDFGNFYKLFSDEEINLIHKYIAINPEELNYRLPYLGMTEIPNDLIPISGQVYKKMGKHQTIPCQFLPKKTFEAYELLNEAIEKDINKKLLILYGYRSPARQVFMFFDILERIYSFDFSKTLQRVCFPAYSEHVYPLRQAIDFVTPEEGTDNFDKTVEYSWLKVNSKKYNFFESYPKNNQLGMMFEPWHWHHEFF
jgi:hypothetical protein